ncbi:D-alanine--D-alanine ligase [Parabacteroides sp.]
MKLRVAIIFGGKSAEHEVSLKSATNISNSMDRTRFIPVLLGIDKSGEWFYNDSYITDDINLADNDYFIEATNVYLSAAGNTVHVISKKESKNLTSFEIAFPIVHGTFGEDGTLQGILKSLNIPFVGPDVLGSAIAMDKDVAKRLFKAADIPVAASYTLYKNAPSEYSFEKIASELGLPIFVKPVNAGSSVGVSKVTNEKEYHAALSTAFRFDNKILVEEAIIGKELECGVLGNENAQASVVGEIVAKDFYSYDAKYISSTEASLQVPARIESGMSEVIRELAVKACKVIGCEGMARVDFLLSKDNKLVLNEINTLPGFTEISMYPKVWEYTGIPETDLITRLITLAMQRHERDTNLSVDIK